MFSIEDDDEDAPLPFFFLSCASLHAASLVRSRMSLTLGASLPCSFRIRLINPIRIQTQLHCIQSLNQCRMLDH